MYIIHKQDSGFAGCNTSITKKIFYVDDIVDLNKYVKENYKKSKFTIYNVLKKIDIINYEVKKFEPKYKIEYDTRTGTEN